MSAQDTTAGFETAIANALTLWAQSQQGPAVEALSAASEAGYTPAIFLTAWFYTQMGHYEEGLPFARRCVDAGVILPGMWWGSWLANQPSRAVEALAFVEAVEDVFPWDVTSFASAWAAQGNTAEAVRVVEILSMPRLAAYREQFESLHQQGQNAVTALTASAAA